MKLDWFQFGAIQILEQNTSFTLLAADCTELFLEIYSKKGGGSAG